MATNRLKLDFSLVTNEERKNFLDNYLATEEFTKRPPNEEELQTMADYLLWGKDPKTGLNGKQSGLDLHSKHKTWDASSVDSLEQLMEQPTFSEASLSSLQTTQFRAKREVFSREEALASASPTVRESFLALFSDIDRIDFMCETYDLLHGKRQKPIRAELLKRFSEEEQRTMRERVTHWNQYHYLKQRHELVELRREQYTLRDSYRTTILSQSDEFVMPNNWEFDVDIPVLPLGVKHDEPLSALVFCAWRDLNPASIHESDLADISNLYWKKKQFAPGAHQSWFDFRELEHVYQLLNFQVELVDYVPEMDVESNLAALLNTLQFYVEQADLSDLHKEILDMKLRKKKNVDIAWDINHKYNKSYTPNYISTIFRQRIIPKINAAAVMHEQIIANIFFPENFKRCTGCGEIKLLCAENFTRKTRSADGFTSRCKKCEKSARQGG